MSRATLVGYSGSGQEVGGKRNLLVLNDEAHHAYRIPRPENELLEEYEALDEETIEEFAQEATVWIDGLDRIQRHRGASTSASTSRQRRTTSRVLVRRPTRYSPGSSVISV